MLGVDHHRLLKIRGSLRKASVQPRPPRRNRLSQDLKFTMQTVVTYSIAIAIGLMTSIWQWRLFVRDPLLAKTFNGHLDDIKRYLTVALVIGGLTAACAAIVQNRLDVFHETFLVFAGTWMCVLAILARREIPADRTEPPIDGEPGVVAHNLSQGLSGVSRHVS